MTIERLVTVTIALVAVATSMCSALTHPDLIPLHMRGGLIYRESMDAHKAFLSGNGFSEPRDADTNWFDQQVNHSDPSSGTFRQRWWVDYSMWDGSGPAFLYINGEAPATGYIPGHALIVARSLGAVVFSLEHRYYGESMPSNYTDLAMLKTLSVETSLADLRAFINYTEVVTVKKSMKWVTIGGSYAGALSAWFKETYPDVAIAAWSSSGVVEAEFNFYDYEGHVMEVMSPVCQDAVRHVMTIAEAMWDNETQRPQLLEMFGAPSYFLKGDFFYMLADAAAGAVQYGHKSLFCDSLLPQNMTDPLGQYNASIVALYGPGFANCYYSTVCLSSVSMSSQWAGAGYAWIYQTCTQLSYWQVGFYNSLRSSSVSTDYFENQCRLAFGQDALPDTFAFNAKFHGKQNQASNVIALQGSDDPWQTAGITTSLGPNYPAVLADCNDCGHCGDLFGPRATDPSSLIKQRAAIYEYISGWLKTQFDDYFLTLNGNFSGVDELENLPNLIFALQDDLRTSFDRSAAILVAGMTNTTLSVKFQVGVTPFNSINVTDAVSLLSGPQNATWLVATSAAFYQYGGKGPLSVQAIRPAAEASASPSSSCETSCYVGIATGAVALLVVISVVVVYRKQKALKLMVEEERLTETASY